MKKFLIGAMALSAVVAHGQIVTNGGFETGDLTGWSLDIANNTTVVAQPFYVHSGSFGLAWGNPSNPAHLSQNLNLTVGQIYELTFWVDYNGSIPSELTASVGGSTLYDQQNASGSNNMIHWQQVNEFFTASAGSEALAFGLRQDGNAYSGLDDVSVQAVPEPPVYFLIGLGVLALLKSRRQA